MTELSRLNLLSPLRINQIFPPKDASKIFLRSISKGSLMAERFSIGRVSEIFLMFKQIIDKDFH
jgi:hypothetical protein